MRIDEKIYVVVGTTSNGCSRSTRREFVTHTSQYAPQRANISPPQP